MVTEGFSSPSNCMLQMFIWYLDGDKRSFAAIVEATDAETDADHKRFRSHSISNV